MFESIYSFWTFHNDFMVTGFPKTGPDILQQPLKVKEVTGSQGSGQPSRGLPPDREKEVPKRKELLGVKTKKIISALEERFCDLSAAILNEIIDNQINFVGNVSNFAVTTVSPDVLAPIGC